MRVGIDRLVALFGVAWRIEFTEHRENLLVSHCSSASIHEPRGSS